MPKPCSKRTRNWAKRCGDWMSARWKRRTCFRRADGEETIHQFLWNGIRSSEVKIGILAVQGDFEAHAAMLERLGAETAEVRTPAQLEGCDGLILRGEHNAVAISAGRRPGGCDRKIREAGRSYFRNVRRSNPSRNRSAESQTGFLETFGHDRAAKCVWAADRERRGQRAHETEKR